MSEPRWKTRISQAFWCHPNEDRIDEAFRPAEDPLRSNESLCWFDRLFYGGIHIPSGTGRPLTFLLTGPPGTGKSTLAMELAYRLAQARPPEGGCGNGLSSLYVATEMSVAQAYEKATSFGWEHTQIFRAYPDVPPEMKGEQSPIEGQGCVLLLASESEQNAQVPTPITPLAALARFVLEELAPHIIAQFANECGAPANASYAELLKRLAQCGRAPLGRLFRRSGDSDDSQPQMCADLLIIDSLNALPAENREKAFEQFLANTHDRARVVIFVLDSDPEAGEHKFWEYVCDNVIRMDCKERLGYYLRSMEIVKARYQQNVHGKQLVRLCPDGHGTDIPPQRQHPYRREGGIFIYPTIHYHLSRYKRYGKVPQTRSPVSKTDDLICRRQDGTVCGMLLPQGRCTAFLGSRGGHKSHIGYIQLLDRLVYREDDYRGTGTCPEDRNPCRNRNIKEGAIVVSLRDDEDMTRNTMERILSCEFGLRDGEAKDKLGALQRDGRLDIVYFHPGYITPEEFFHRVYMSVLRMKAMGHQAQRVTLLFNSLDQLSARFPLCADQNIFVPGIIDSLSGEGVTSMFVAVDEPGQPAEQYGLLPMADLVLSFRPRIFTEDQYRNIVQRGLGGEIDVPSGDHEAIVLQVLRFAGGRMAGHRGLLEIVEEHELSPYRGPGLHYVSIQRGEDYGQPLQLGK